MSHEALILEDGDTIYVGVPNNGQLHEVRLSNARGVFLLTDDTGSRFIGPASPPPSFSCPQCGHNWHAAPLGDSKTCPAGVGGGELCECPAAWHHA